VGCDLDRVPDGETGEVLDLDELIPHEGSVARARVHGRPVTLARELTPERGDLGKAPAVRSAARTSTRMLIFGEISRHYVRRRAPVVPRRPEPPHLHRSGVIFGSGRGSRCTACRSTLLARLGCPLPVSRQMLEPSAERVLPRRTGSAAPHNVGRGRPWASSSPSWLSSASSPSCSGSCGGLRRAAALRAVARFAASWHHGRRRLRRAPTGCSFPLISRALQELEGIFDGSAGRSEVHAEGQRALRGLVERDPLAFTSTDPGPVRRDFLANACPDFLRGAPPHPLERVVAFGSQEAWRPRHETKVGRAEGRTGPRMSRRKLRSTA
jgi:hypothetical protein